MFEFVIGVVIGAMFAPFWMKVWSFVKETEMFKKLMSMVKKDDVVK